MAELFYFYFSRFGSISFVIVSCACFAPLHRLFAAGSFTFLKIFRCRGSSVPGSTQKFFSPLFKTFHRVVLRAGYASGCALLSAPRSRVAPLISAPNTMQHLFTRVYVLVFPAPAPRRCSACVSVLDVLPGQQDGVLRSCALRSLLFFKLMPWRYFRACIFMLWCPAPAGRTMFYALAL